MKLRPRILFAAALALAISTPSLAHADGAWLDKPPLSWNSAGMPIPQAPGADESVNDEFCAQMVQQPRTAAERAVAAAGWTLVQAESPSPEIEQVFGVTGFDGMCRAMGYNFFIFVDGKFAGTTSPVLMYSRTDGTGGPLQVEASRLVAHFGRYGPYDALCCPTRPSATVEYYIDHTPAGPVLVPDNYYLPADMFPPEGVSASLKAAVARVYREGFVPRDLHTYDETLPLRVLIGVHAAPGENDLNQAFFFLGNEYLGTDTLEPSHYVGFVDNDGSTVTLEYAVLNPNQPGSCWYGSDVVQVRYHWDGTHLTPLDPIPAFELRDPDSPCH